MRQAWATVPSTSRRSLDLYDSEGVHLPAYMNAHADEHDTVHGDENMALEMLDQFRTDLGLYATDGLLPDPLRTTYNGQQNAVDGALTQAQTTPVLETHVHAARSYPARQCSTPTSS
jgi:hypothetical protein